MYIRRGAELAKFDCTSPVPKFKGDTLWGLARHEAYYFKDSSRVIEDIVRARDIRFAEDQHVAQHHVSGGDAFVAPVAHDACRRRGHPLQGRDRLLGARLLPISSPTATRTARSRRALP